jgi:hypothetical protein
VPVGEGGVSFQLGSDGRICGHCGCSLVRLHGCGVGMSGQVGSVGYSHHWSCQCPPHTRQVAVCACERERGVEAARMWISHKGGGCMYLLTSHLVPSCQRPCTFHVGYSAAVDWSRLARVPTHLWLPYLVLTTAGCVYVPAAAAIAAAAAVCSWRHHRLCAGLRWR